MNDGSKVSFAAEKPTIAEIVGFEKLGFIHKMQNKCLDCRTFKESYNFAIRAQDRCCKSRHALG